MNQRLSSPRFKLDYVLICLLSHLYFATFLHRTMIGTVFGVIMHARTCLNLTSEGKLTTPQPLLVAMTNGRL